MLGDPETGRVLGDLEVKNSSAVMGNHKEAVQHAKGESGRRTLKQVGAWRDWERKNGPCGKQRGAP